jgi:hypothetical protein
VKLLSRFDPERLKLIARVALAVALAAPALWQLWLVIRIYAARVTYPWDIEWLESSALYEAYRISNFQRTYGPPSQGFLPLFHPPGYLYAVALLGRLTRVDYAMARTLTFSFFVMAVVVVVGVFWRHQRNRIEGTTAGLLAIGCAGAGVPMTMGFYDLVRADTMAWALCMLAAALAEPVKLKPGRIALLSVVMTIALYTRLLTVFLILWIHIFVLVRHKKSGFSLALVTSSLCGLVLVALQFGSQGWFWIYVVGSLQEHIIQFERFPMGIKLFLEYAPFAAALPLWALALAFTKKLSGTSVLWLGLLLMSLPAALLPFAKLGGYGNDFMPFVLVLGPTTLLLAADTARAFGKRWPKVGAGVRYLAFAGIGVFLVLRSYDIKPLVPNEVHRAKARALNEFVAGLEGGVIAPRHPFLPIRNGHRTRQFNNMTYLDAMWGQVPGLRLGAYLDAGRARWALVMGTESPNVTPDIAFRYQLVGPMPAGPLTIVGEHSTVTHLLRLREPRVEQVIFDFEDELSDGWQVYGNAFDDSPTVARPRWQSGIYGVMGERAANSYQHELRDAAVGTLTSPPFVIDMSQLSLRVGGGRGVAVELYVGQRVVQRASPLFFNQELLMEVVWDVSPFLGEEAHIRLVDTSTGTWGHLLVDHVILFEVITSPPGPPLP